MTAFCSSGKFNGREGNGNKVNRKAYAAGKFYTDKPDGLKTQLGSLFRQAAPARHPGVIAIVSPHAGYVYSGGVAASAFNQIDTTRTYKNVFVIASSHRDYFNGASIYNLGNYETPLGEVEVDIELADRLIAASPVFSASPKYHDMEHSLEVQLPFLQYRLGNDIRLIPIIIGTDKKETCAGIADALQPYFTPENLFVISTDFSHYPDYDDAVRVDARTARAIAANDPDSLLKTLRENERAGIPGLATSLCGYTSVLTLLDMTRDQPGLKIEEIQYLNSGDSPYGEKDRVVGYHALAVYGELKAQEEPHPFSLPESDRRQLLALARKTLGTYLETGDIPDPGTERFSEAASRNAGAFVTLRKDRELRGCIGRFTADEPLYRVVQQMAVAAATQDTRFSRVRTEELKKIHIEISVLSPMKKIDSIEEIELGRHGIYIRQGYRNGTFLPQVATETGWTKEEFLGHCARDKAGIGWDGWKDAEIFTYEAFVFEEK